MNAAHYHLLINHAPIFGSLFGFFIFLWGIIRKDPMIKKVAAYLFLFTALTAIIATQTGEGAEEVAEDIPAVSHHAIHEHEEAAEASMWLIYLTAFASMGWLVADHKKASYERIIGIILLLLAIGTVGSLAYTGYKGGEIRHPEISSSFNSEH